ncbi:hypothetical protein [Agromyces binzhouensis]|uniref:hypothetical protein n=1 Tax=Agromyces binzhouensis TaxID=1817495 RepID=UPI00362E490E
MGESERDDEVGVGVAREPGPPRGMPMTTNAPMSFEYGDLFSYGLPEGYDARWQDFVDPLQTLEALVDATIERVSEGQDIGRIRARLMTDPQALLAPSYESMQVFLLASEAYRKRLSRRHEHPLVRWIGLGILLLGIAGGVAGLLFAPFALAGSLGISTPWAVAISAGFVVSLGLAFWFSLDASIDWPFYLSVVLAVLAAIAGCVLAAMGIVGLSWTGFVSGLGIAAVVAALGIIGGRVWSLYSTSDGESVQSAYNAWRGELFQSSVLPALNAAINSISTDAYSLNLDLNRRINPESATAVVDTAAASSLREFMAARTKGSFALAGPRGSGKSTLLHRWASGAYASRSSNEKLARRDLIVEVSAPVGYDQKEFLVHLFGRLCDAVERYVRRYEPQALTNGSVLTGARARRMVSEQDVRQSRREVSDLAELVKIAREERDAIRFVQSTTFARELSAGIGYSGLSVGGKASGSVRRDDVPLNYPELVDEFRWFLEQAARVITDDPTHVRRLSALRPGGTRPPNTERVRRAHVLVAIDELDRISDGDLAQKFLNELKALFGVPNCFYLVSVSEDALAEFELAAMGMRTVFDSAFDEIIRVDYLRLSEARALLDHLIVGLPRPFVALAYVLSGGLARQVVRIAYQMAEMGYSSEGGAAIDTVSSGLVQRQLYRTLRAAVDQLFGILGSGSGTALFRVIDDWPVAEVPTGGRLRELESRLRALEVESNGNVSIDESASEGRVDAVLIDGLRDEVAAMCNYLATILETFDHGLDESAFELHLQPGAAHFDVLARARRYLGANPRAADELLHAFRSASTERERVG